MILHFLCILARQKNKVVYLETLAAEFGLRTRVSGKIIFLLFVVACMDLFAYLLCDLSCMFASFAMTS